MLAFEWEKKAGTFQLTSSCHPWTGGIAFSNCPGLAAWPPKPWTPRSEGQNAQRKLQHLGSLTTQLSKALVVSSLSKLIFWCIAQVYIFFRLQKR